MSIIRNTNNEIKSASCNCCGKKFNINWGNISDKYFLINGYKNSRNEHIAILCISCTEDKLKDIKFDIKDTTIGYC